MPSGLDEFGQGRWASGMVRAVARHLIPEDAAWDIQNGLLDDDGNIYLRGATKRLTTNECGINPVGRLHALWEASFFMGRRTIGNSMTGNNRIGLLAPGSTAWVLNTGASGTVAGGLMTQIGDFAFLPTDATTIAYAGSLKTASYQTGTVTLTAGSKTVTGAGTAWLANADAGMILGQTGGGNLGIVSVVESVDSNTQITLRDPWVGTTVAGTGYQLNVTYGLQTTLGPYQITAGVAGVGGRLFIIDGRKVRMSLTIDPNTGKSRLWPFETVSTYVDFHEFPADVIALAVLRERLFVFTKAGIYVISNPALEQVDAYGNPQQRVDRISGDVVLRAPSGLAPWRDSMVVCATDGVYVMDASGGLELISRAIAPLWQTYAAAGYVPGQIATFRDHAFIPLFDPLSSGAGTGLMLVARLDRRVKTPAGDSAPWVSLTGEAGAVRSVCVQDPYGAAKVVAGTYANGYLLDLTPLFSTGPLLPSGSVATTATDAIGTTYGLTLETREYVLDAGNVATVKDVALEYEAAPAGGSIGVAVSVSQRATADVDPTFTALGALTSAGNFATQAPRVRAINREARRVAFRITTTGSVAAIRIRGLRGRARLRGRRR